MKKRTLFKKLLIICIGLSMIMSSLELAYAGGGGSEEKKEDPPTVGSWQINGNGTTNYPGARQTLAETYTTNEYRYVKINKKLSGSRKVEITHNDLYSYVLEVSTGINPGDSVEAIDIRYVATDGRLYTQTLLPRQNADDLIGNVYNSVYASTDSQKKSYAAQSTMYTSDNAPDQARNYNTGSRYASYNSLIREYGGADGDSARETDSGKLYFMSYYTMALQMMRMGMTTTDSNAENTYGISQWNTGEYYLQEYYPGYLISHDGDEDVQVFDSYTTEYLRFTLEYEVSLIVEVDFILNTENRLASWSLNKWKLYRVSEIRNESYEYNNQKYNKTYNYEPEFCSYSYLSNRLSMIFTNYTCMLLAESANDETLGITPEYANGIIRFVANDTNDLWTLTYQLQKDCFLTYQYAENSAQDSLDHVYLMRNDATVWYGEDRDKNEFEQSTKPVVYNFQIEFADEYGAGIDSYMSIWDWAKIREKLYAEISYTNDWGFEEHVTVPVVSNTLLAITDSKDTAGKTLSQTSTLANLFASSNVFLFAQQGQTLCFPVEFPNLKKLNSITLHYDEDDVNDPIIIKDIKVYQDSCTTDRQKYYQNTCTVIEGRGNSFYSCSPTVPDNSKLLYYIKSEDINTTFDSATRTHDYELVSQSSITEAEKDYSDTYLVTINTADVDLGGTTDNVYIQFSYLTTSGGETVTDEINVSEAVTEYYGYHPGYVTSGYDANDENYFIHYCGTTASTAKTTDVDSSESAEQCKDCSYLYGVRQGGTVSFFVKAQDLSRFTGFKVRVVRADQKTTTTAVDEWQLGGLTIQSVTSVGKRQCIMFGDGSDETKLVSVANLKVNHTFKRDVQGTVIYDNQKINIYITNNETYSYDIESEDISGDQNVERDYQDYYYSMSYEIASSNLDFDKASRTYQVTVNVAGAEDSKSDDDSGSQNLYYFQLVFENGVSAYVLANQQLQSDGFRTGTPATFSISINEDFGDVTAVRVIPDDITSDSDHLDKLNIDSIEILKVNSSGINKLYKVESFGWVGSEFRDTSTTEIEGRSVNELAVTKEISSKAYVLNLEFAIEYGAYPERGVEKTDANGDTYVVDEAYPQFTGTMVAGITYLNSNGEKVYKEYNVAEYLYAYSGRSVVKDADGKIVVDKDWMFRGNTTDRFIIPVDDATVIQSIELKGTPNETTKLNITGIRVDIVKGSSRAYITKVTSSEFIRQYSQGSETLCTKITNRKFPTEFQFNGLMRTSYLFKFDEEEGTIPAFESEEATTIVSRVPESKNDTLNVYVYLQDDANTPTVAKKNLTTTLKYSAVTGNNVYKVAITRYNEKLENGQKVLYATGLSATNMSSLRSVNVSADYGYDKAYIDHIVVQQIRNDTVINTYYVSLSGTDAASAVLNSLNVANSADRGDKQVVTLQMSEDMTEKFLSAEKYDVAVAFRYTSSLGDATKVYQSEYVYLSDSGATSVRPGQLTEFVFNESNVGAITEVIVIGVNGLAGTVVGGSIVSYNSDYDGQSEATYFNITSSGYLSTGGTKFTVASKGLDNTTSMKRADFTVTTLATAENLDSNGSTPIKANIVYKDVNGVTQTYTVNDIRTIATSDSSFKAGGTASFSVLLKGIDSISYIEFEPADSDENTTTSWNLGSLTFKVENTDSDTERTVYANQTIYEGTPLKVNLSSMVVKLIASVNGKSGQLVTNGQLNLSAVGKDKIKIETTVSGAMVNKSYTVKIEKVVGEGTSTYQEETTSSDTSFTFEVPENTTTSVVSYKITVASAENSEIKSVVMVSVPGVVATTPDTEVSIKDPD